MSKEENTLKTGTTTIGVVCQDCVILVADKRVTAGYLVVDKNTNKRAAFKKIGFVIDCYYLWDLFHYKVAFDRLRRARLEELILDEDEAIQKLANETRKFSGFLKKVAEDSGKVSTDVIHDMFSNAERRNKEGKTDDAILRLYRIVEMAAQERLISKYNINTSDVKPDQIPPKLSDDFIKFYKNQQDGMIKLPQNAAYRLLNEKGDGLGKIFIEKEAKFRNLQSTRNHSYLAHGFIVCKENTYQSLKDFVLGLDIINPDIVPVFPEIEL